MPRQKHVLLIGGGHAHVTALRWLARNPQRHIRLTLVNSGARAAYSGMVPGVVAGHFDRADAEVDLVTLCEKAGASFMDDSAVRLDPDADQVALQSGKTVNFDLASIDVGIMSGPEDPMPGSRSILVKPMTGFLDEWERLTKDPETRDRLPPIAIIGGGLGGIELALAIRHFAGRPDPDISIIERSSRILEHVSNGLRDKLEKELAAQEVRVFTHATADRHEKDGVHLGNGSVIRAGLVVWAAGARPQEWLAASGLACQDGFPVVESSLRSVSHPNIFVCGDTAHFGPRPLVKAGVHAVRQGPVLMQNLARAASEDALLAYTPQSDYLKLVSLGRRAALADKWGICVSLPGLWGLKRRIDCRFIQDS